jgi:two-component sensor histidine kinase
LPWAIAVTSVSLAGAVLLRWVASPLLADNSPYPPFLVAALLATLAGGPWAGAATALFGGLIANLLFVGDPWRFEVTVPSLAALAIYWALGGLVVLVAQSMASAIRRERALNDQLCTLTGELDHRSRNMLAVIQSIIRQTEGSAATVRDFRRQLEDRLQAVAVAQSLLSEAHGRPVRIDDLVRRVLAPFAPDDRYSEPVDGPEIELSPELAVALALLLHELATNAAKHGSLSTDGGRIAFSWERRGSEVAMSWRESGGPGVVLSDRRGFGSRLFQAALPPHRGSVKVHFVPEGVRADIRVIA